MIRYYLLAAFIFLSSITRAQHSARVDFDRGWKFRLDSTGRYSDPAINDAAWRSLDLPHDWSIEGAFDKDNPAGTGGGALPGGMGWYRKTFTIDASKKSSLITIGFDGVYRNSEVFINGHSLGIRPYGYSSFSYDLTPYLNYGDRKNVLAVKVDNSRQPNSRWYSGSGIYRNVWLTTLSGSHIDEWGTFITTPIVNSKEAVVHIKTSVSGVNDARLTLVTEIYDSAGNKVASSTRAATGAASEQLVVKGPKLWSVERPYLYKAVSTLRSGTVVVDRYETRFGIRYFDFNREKGFSLNGKPLKILGVCDHHDLGALGAAVNKRALQRQLQLLKAMGCNGIRTSHNPPAPELLDLADEMGFIVMDEAFDMWAKAKSPYDYHLDWNEWHRRDLEDLIRRDRNHPSVFIWSVGNEIYEQWTDDSSGRVIARELVSIVKALDTTRPITTANNEIKYNHLIQSGAFELVGYNYNHNKWGDFLKDWPGKKLIVTESTSALETRGHYDRVPFDTIRRWPERWDRPLANGNKDLTVSAYDQVSTPWGSLHEESVKELLKWDHVSGMYIWTGFDYLGEPTPYPWPARSSYFGIIDLAGFPKDVYYMYQSVFTDRPVLHIYPHWNWQPGDTVDVVSYYNAADEVELFLNGRSLGVRSKKGDELHVKWRVAYAPGTLKAVSRKGGKTVLTREVKTAGKPYKLVLQADRSAIGADGKDLSFVTVVVADRNGVPVPDAADTVVFSVNGTGFIAGVDNGNPVSLEPFKSNRHTAMNGKALCILQSNGKKGTITLSASAAGLLPATIRVSAK